MTTEALARRLRAHGIPITGVSEPSETLDGNIDITSAVSVQVGHDLGDGVPYAIVERWDAATETFHEHPARNHRETAAIANDIREALRDASPATEEETPC